MITDYDPSLRFAGKSGVLTSMHDVSSNPQQAMNWVGAQVILFNTTRTSPARFIVTGAGDGRGHRRGILGIDDLIFDVVSMDDPNHRQVASAVDIVRGVQLRQHACPPAEDVAALAAADGAAYRAPPSSGVTFNPRPIAGNPKDLFTSHGSEGKALADAIDKLSASAHDGGFSLLDLPTGALVMACADTVRNAPPHTYRTHPGLRERAQSICRILLEQNGVRISEESVIEFAFFDFTSLTTPGGLARFHPQQLNPMAAFGPGSLKPKAARVSIYGDAVHLVDPSADGLLAIAPPQLTSVHQVEACLAVLFQLLTLWHGGHHIYRMSAALTGALQRLLAETIDFTVSGSSKENDTTALELYAFAIDSIFSKMPERLRQWASSLGATPPLASPFNILGSDWDSECRKMTNQVLHRRIVRSIDLRPPGKSASAPAPAPPPTKKAKQPHQAQGTNDQLHPDGHVYSRFAYSYDKHAPQGILALVAKLHPHLTGPLAYSDALKLWDSNTANHTAKHTPKCWLAHAAHGGSCHSKKCARCDATTAGNSRPQGRNR